MKLKMTEQSFLAVASGVVGLFCALTGDLGWALFFAVIAAMNVFLYLQLLSIDRE